jgi:predicted esterase
MNILSRPALVFKLIPLVLLNFFLLQAVYSSTTDASGLWVRNYPTISKGLTEVLIKIRLTQPGKVYYVFYDDKVQDITASQIKSDAIAGNGEHIQRRGTINYPLVPSAVNTTIGNFDREQAINLYLVPESNEGVLNEGDIKYVHFLMHFKHRIIPIDSTDAPYGYLEYLSAGYSKGSDEKYPLVVFLHGSGGVGGGHYSDLINSSTCMREGLTRYLEMDMDLPAVVISPQAPSTFDPTILDTFIDFLLSHYSVDPDRICVTGISMGGGSTWQYGYFHGERLSSLVPLCGNYVCVNYSSMINLPVWAFHNDSDPTVPVAYTYNNINGIIKAGGEPFMSIFDTDDHSCAYEAYYYPGLWNWVFSQRKGKGYIEAGVVNAIKSVQSITVDGKHDEPDWGNSWHTIPASLQEDSAAGAKFNLLWDQNYLYSAVSLSKKIYQDNNKTISVYLNGNNNQEGEFDSYDYQLKFSSSGNAEIPSAVAGDCRYKWAETDSSYDWEMAFPLNKTIYADPFSGNGLGFDLEIESDSALEGYPQKLFWKGSLLDSLNTNHFGDILLSGKTNVPVSATMQKTNSSELLLLQNYPNPFTESTTISYSIPRQGKVTLTIYNSNGREIKKLIEEEQDSGKHTCQLYRSTLDRGIYLYRLRYENDDLCRRFVIF